MPTKPKPKLGYIGMGIVEEREDKRFKFDRDQREAIDACLLGQDIREWPKGFIWGLEAIIAELTTFSDLQKTAPTPSERLAGLDLLDRAIDTLIDFLNGLDSETQAKIYQAVAKDARFKESWTDRRRRAVADLADLSGYVGAAIPLPDPKTKRIPVRRGRARDPRRNVLEQRLAAFFEQCSLPIVGAEGSLFKSVLSTTQTFLK